MENNENMMELGFDELEQVAGGKSAGQKVVATGDVNIRKGPGLKYDIIGSISKGTKLEFLGEIKKDDRGVAWGKVSYKGKTGWMSSKYAKKA